jgi:hypothetical protein
MIEGVTQGLGSLVTNSGLRCSQSSRVATGLQRVRRSAYCTVSFSVCSRRRTELPIIYADFRLDYKLATLPAGHPVGSYDDLALGAALRA